MRGSSLLSRAFRNSILIINYNFLLLVLLYILYRMFPSARDFVYDFLGSLYIQEYLSLLSERVNDAHAIFKIHGGQSAFKPSACGLSFWSGGI